MIHLDAVGAHVSDRAIFIECLRQPHRVRRRKTELARSFLLQSRGGKGRWRIACERFGFNRDDRETPRFDRSLGAFRVTRIADRQSFNLFALVAHETSDEADPVMLHIGDDRPIFLRAEHLDLAFAVNHKPQRHGLDAAGRFRARQLAPQHG